MKQQRMLIDCRALEKIRDQENLIINQPGLQKLGSKIGFHILTLAFWSIWVFLWLPIFGVVNLFNDIEIVHGLFNQMENKMLVYDIFSLFVVMVSCMIAVISLWSIYRLLRYGNRRSQRYSVPLTNPQKLSILFKIPEIHISVIQKTRRIMFHFYNDGRIKQINQHNAIITHGP